MKIYDNNILLKWLNNNFINSLIRNGGILIIISFAIWIYADGCARRYRTTYNGPELTSRFTSTENKKEIIILFTYNKNYINILLNNIINVTEGTYWYETRRFPTYRRVLETLRVEWRNSTLRRALPQHQGEEMEI